MPERVSAALVEACEDAASDFDAFLVRTSGTAINPIKNRKRMIRANGPRFTWMNSEEPCQSSWTKRNASGSSASRPDVGGKPNRRREVPVRCRRGGERGR